MNPAPLPAEDRIRHEDAVWRESPPAGLSAGLLVSVDYGDGMIEQSTSGLVDWPRVARWRFGWGPE